MNFLAHALLSSSDGEVLMGNMMTDFLKPGVTLPTNARILTGIERHYAIDHFTDSHPLVARSRARLFPLYRHYAAVLVDVFYDHLLATNWARFCDVSLPHFAQWVYDELGAHRAEMPPRMLNVVPSMMADNWLVSYAKPEGVRHALYRVQHRSRHAPTAQDAWNTLAQDHAAYEAEFLEFFPLLIELCAE